MTMTMPTTAAALLLSAATALPQDRPDATPRKPVVPLNVEVILSKQQGAKSVANLPYTLTCHADDRPSSHLRMGIEVPVMVSPAKEGTPAYQYRSIGTNIDCRSSALDDGRFRLDLTIENSSIYSTPEDAGRPLFRTFKSTFAPVLRGAEKMRYTMATDPVTGEVVTVDVTVTPLK
jgi:hypothetical protein